MESWITDSPSNDRFRYYTRGNADEVGPDPWSPLGWTMAWEKGCCPGVAGGYVEYGVFDLDEFPHETRSTFGLWGGYFYNCLSMTWVFGVRMPGATPEAINLAYFGDRPDVPEYEEHPEDVKEGAEALVAESMAWVMSTDDYPMMEERSETAKQAVKNRPNHVELSNEELVKYAREMVELLEYVWVPSCVSALACSLGPGAVQAICDGIGRSEDAVKLMSAVGDVESAGASFRMWDLSRIIRNSEELSIIFDGDSHAALEKIKSLDSNDAKKFITNWEELIEECGHRGPNEWDMRSHSWTTKPELPISMLERLRFQEDDKSPHIASIKSAEIREKITAEILDLVKDEEETHGTLTAAIKSAALFFGLREMGKNAAIRAVHEAKLSMMELGKRMVEVGAIDDPQQLFMITESELDGFLVDPVSMRDTILQRDKDFSYLHEVEPPYIVDGKVGIPPISDWPKRGVNKSSPAEVGEVLQGSAGAPGIATGIARVILDPSDASSLQPGDVMIAPTTDPSWTPLFMTASAVVVNVGAVASHAAIVSRELGIPCAVSVKDATDRITDGSTITVDGSTGIVTIDK
tara:strand:+ start:281 stop:2014 length:1734 start_codon:yes stop_codon:yes gene_type:complete